MSKKANPTTIGLFIVIGVVLGVAGLILFSSAKFFSKTEKYVLYFDASVKGLNPGAPVKFRGVTVGSVLEVRIRFHQAEDDLTMPVIIELNEDLLREKTDRTTDLSDEANYELQVQKGFRGMLQAQSLVTGLLYVELEYLPEAPPPVFRQQKKVYKEIPTAPTEIQELMANLAQVDLKGITDKLNALLAKLDTTVAELKVEEISTGLTNLLASVNRLINSPELTNTFVATERTLNEIRALSEKVRSKVDPLVDRATNTFHEANLTLTELRGGAQDLRDMLAPEASVRRDLSEAVEELGRAARSITVLVDFLSRNPNALISGKKQKQ